jgi:metal-responsive CopG/Arc/MetJ family transcriptional regulator
MLVRTQVLFDENTLRKLKAAAEEQGRSVSDLVRELVESGLERQRQQELQRFEALLQRLRQIRESNAAKYGEVDADLLERIREERSREQEDVLWGSSS